MKGGTISIMSLAVLLAGCTAVPSPSVGGSGTPPETSTRPTEPDSTATTMPSPSPMPLAWTSLEVGAGPSSREDHTWTLGGEGRTAYLFGGREGTTVHGDLWAFDLDSNTWTQLTASGPAPRFGHEATWVDGFGLVIFAGQAGSAFFNDLWAYDPHRGAWSQLPADGDVPVARYGTCAALGPDDRLWISHGFTSDGVRFADTVAYDFDSGGWTDETPSDGARPVERCLHGCWWTDEGTLTLYAGQTTGVTALDDRWDLADDRWSRVDGVLPPERNLYARTRLVGATLIFGGQTLDGSFLGDLWILGDRSADAAALEVVGGAGPRRAGAEIVRDAANGRVLLFGGRDEGGAHDDLWELSGDPISNS